MIHPYGIAKKSGFFLSVRLLEGWSSDQTSTAALAESRNDMCSAVRRNDGMKQVNLQIPLSSAHIPYRPSYISYAHLFMIDHLWRTSNPRGPRFTKPLSTVPDLLCNMLLSRSTAIRPVTVCSNVVGSESDQAPNLSYHIFRLSAHHQYVMPENRG